MENGELFEVKCRGYKAGEYMCLQENDSTFPRSSPDVTFCSKNAFFDMIK